MHTHGSCTELVALDVQIGILAFLAFEHVTVNIGREVFRDFDSSFMSGTINILYIGRNWIDISDLLMNTETDVGW